MRERQDFNFSELEIQPKGIRVKDNLGIETKEGLVDILVGTKLLEGDILTAVERQSPQFLEKAVDLIDNLHFYLGKRPLVDVVLEELATREEADEERLRVLRRVLQAREVVSLGLTYSIFYADEECPFFYFNTPKIIKEFGQGNSSNQFEKCWLHERQLLIEFLDPTKRDQLYKDQEERLVLFGIIEGLGGATFTLAIARNIFMEKAKRRRVSRRTFLKVGLGGVIGGGIASLIFSPLAYMISNEFTYWRGHAAEEAGRQAQKQGVLIRPFEEIFQIRFHS